MRCCLKWCGDNMDKFEEYHKWCDGVQYRLCYQYTKQLRVISWCIEKFGPQKFSIGDCRLVESASKWDYDDGAVYFENSNDAMLFKLKWG